MPTYGYECLSCDNQFEIFQSIKDDPLKVCDSCGGVLRKRIYPVGISFKGSGFYVNDYAPKSGGSSAPADAGKVDAPKAEVSGETKSDAPKAEPAKTEAKPETKTESKPEAKTPAAALSSQRQRRQGPGTGSAGLLGGNPSGVRDAASVDALSVAERLPLRSRLALPVPGTTPCCLQRISPAPYGTGLLSSGSSACLLAARDQQVPRRRVVLHVGVQCH